MSTVAFGLIALGSLCFFAGLFALLEREWSEGVTFTVLALLCFAALWYL